MRMSIQTDARARVYAGRSTNVRTYVDTYVRVRVLPHVRACVYSYVRADTHTYVCACIYPYIQTLQRALNFAHATRRDTCATAAALWASGNLALNPKRVQSRVVAAEMALGWVSMYVASQPTLAQRNWAASFGQPVHSAILNRDRGPRP